jgi:hypothetical protein
MSVGTLARVFIVDIWFTEPTYGLYSGTAAEVRHCLMRVTTSNAAAASDMASAEFRRMAEVSGVGWVREISHIEVREEPR